MSVPRQLIVLILIVSVIKSIRCFDWDIFCIRSVGAIATNPKLYPAKNKDGAWYETIWANFYLTVSNLVRR
ncbi:MAG: hypothetical protein CMO98_10645 [Woeseia sp.]|nr:hypothetical protein [Woeseia sp.]